MTSERLVVPPDEPFVLRPEGDLDAARAAQLLAEATGAAQPLVTIDLAGVRFTDSGGLGGLIRLRSRLRAAGRDVVLRNPTPQLVRLLSITGTRDQFRWR